MMLKRSSRISLSFVAYVLLLMGFASLGAFVYALATGSYVAGAVGGALVILFGLSAVGFRAGARQIAESNESGITIDGANVWAKPLRRAQINQYLLNYRTEDVVPELVDADEQAAPATAEVYSRAA
jgi:hypothetical protein